AAGGAAAGLADRGPGAGADIAFRDWRRRRGVRGAIAAIRTGADLRIAAEPEIDQDRGRHDRDDPRRSHRVADVMLVEPFHDAGRRVETISAAAGEDDGVDDLHVVHRIEQISLARPRGAAADVDAS